MKNNFGNGNEQNHEKLLAICMLNASPADNEPNHLIDQKLFFFLRKMETYPFIRTPSGKKKKKSGVFSAEAPRTFHFFLILQKCILMGFGSKKKG